MLTDMREMLLAIYSGIGVDHSIYNETDDFANKNFFPEAQ